MPSYTHLQPNPSPQRSINGARESSVYFNPLKRIRTPDVADNQSTSSLNGGSLDDREGAQGDDRRRAMMRDLYARSQRMVDALFAEKSIPVNKSTDPSTAAHSPGLTSLNHLPNGSRVQPTPKTGTKRKIDEDDYGDDDEDDEDQDEPERPEIASPLAARKIAPLRFNGSLLDARTSTPAPPLERKATNTSSHDTSKSSEEVRKRLEEEKKAAENAAKDSFQSMFYTLENDSIAMVEQQKLDELDRQVETEMSGGSSGHPAANGAPRQGTLSNTNLGASSLTLKHLIARIDAKRHMVKATDSHLRSLMSEVRKNRSKWANEDKVGQEELYEAAERVLMELKAMTEWAGPFLQKVNKRDAPDYYTIIKQPMDIGTMIKKLKQLQYKSKKDFVSDLDLIWANCLKYNAEPNHFLRKKAEHMKKETARLIPLIPDITVRDRADVEAEERRLQQDFDNDEDSEDEPIMTSRGRMAPGKSSKKGTGNARKALPATEDQPKADPLTLFKNEHLRSDADSVTDVSLHGHSTPPPPGSNTPLRVNGIGADGGPTTHADTSEVDGPSASGTLGQSEDPFQEDEEYQMWKQITKKDRAHVAAERHRLFKDNRINPEEPALLRTKASMRQWLRQQKLEPDEKIRIVGELNATEKENELSDQGATLAEGIESEEETTLPDYYFSSAGIPFVDEKLVWKEDSEGHIVDRQEQCIRVLPSSYFSSPRSLLSSKIESNLRQMQETRKVVAKIGIVKQMQVQAQTYQNQFQKYDPEPFAEADTGPVVVTSDGAVMAALTCRAALRRSVGKIFFHAGFEDFQPAAIEAITDVASEYFTNIARTLGIYHNAAKVYDTTAADASSAEKQPSLATTSSMDPFLLGLTKSNGAFVSRFTTEEQVLHTLQQCGSGLNEMDTYINEEVGRLSTKLETHHTRTKEYLAELLRPALDPATAGTDGVGAFNDGSEQFVGGDFAEDIDEDFFGFRELGLDKEFGIPNLSVPLHLLQSRVHNAYQPTSTTTTTGTGPVMETPAPYPPITAETLEIQIGLVKEFFQNKLDSSGNNALIEDDDLPAKQRFPKPRLPPTGKISSPRKRPIREQQMLARKKKRLEIEAGREREAAERAEAEANALALANPPTTHTEAPVEPTAPNTSDANVETTIDAAAEEANTEVVTNSVPEVNGAADIEISDFLVDGVMDDPTSQDTSLVNGEAELGSTAGTEKPAEQDSETAKNLESPTGVLKLGIPSSDTNGHSSGDPQKVDSSTEKDNTPGKQLGDAGSGGKQQEQNKDKDEDKEDFDMLNSESMTIAAH